MPRVVVPMTNNPAVAGGEPLPRRGGEDRAAMVSAAVETTTHPRAHRDVDPMIVIVRAGDGPTVELRGRHAGVMTTTGDRVPARVMTVQSVGVVTTTDRCAVVAMMTDRCAGVAMTNGGREPAQGTTDRCAVVVLTTVRSVGAPTAIARCEVAGSARNVPIDRNGPIGQPVPSVGGWMGPNRVGVVPFAAGAPSVVRGLSARRSRSPRPT